LALQRSLFTDVLRVNPYGFPEEGAKVFQPRFGGTLVYPIRSVPSVVSPTTDVELGELKLEEGLRRG
jgi:hypothetical protein